MSIIICSSDDIVHDGAKHKPDCYMVAKVPAYCWHRSCTCGAAATPEEGK